MSKAKVVKEDYAADIDKLIFGKWKLVVKLHKEMKELWQQKQN